MNLTIKSNIRDYSVFFKCSFDFLHDLKKIDNSVFIIDNNVFNLYKELFVGIKSDSLFLFDAIEKNKTYAYIGNIYDFLISKSAKRNLTIISIGGGITQDLTGFAASTLYRGVNWIFIPTTFLAMTDSCIGSKTSLNYGTYKNLIGTFYPPQKIYIQPDFLNTLSKIDFYNGIGESIKFQILKEKYPKNFENIRKKIQKIISDQGYRAKIIYENMKIKLNYMKNDEFDLGKRNLLNYGHCFGHAIETVSNYYVPHGIAVTIGMIFANLLSLKRDMANKNDVDFVNDKILKPCIPLAMRKFDFNADKLLFALKNDKKRVGKNLTVIVPDNEFKLIKLCDVREDEFAQTLEETKKILL